MALEVYMVTVNGVPFKRWMSKSEAYAFAERWQGQHGGYRGGQGLLKHKDRGDHVEAKRDIEAEKEMLERYKTFKAGDPQTVVYQERVEG
jgi:hypothetical protein